MKSTTYVGACLVAAGLLVAGPSAAQSGSNGSSAQSSQSSQSRDQNAGSGQSSSSIPGERREDGNMDWGWLGLLGLIGLAGLRRNREDHVTRGDMNVGRR